MIFKHCDDNGNIVIRFPDVWYVCTYTALSEKEIGANPGGTPKTFWLPV